MHRKRSEDQVGYVDYVFAFFAAEKQETFAWIELFCSSEYCVEQCLWNLDCGGCGHGNL